MVYQTQVRRRPAECPKGHGAGYTASAARQHHILPPPARKVALIVSRLAMTASRTGTARSSCPASRLSTVSRPGRVQRRGKPTLNHSGEGPDLASVLLHHGTDRDGRGRR